LKATCGKPDHKWRRRGSTTGEEIQGLLPWNSGDVDFPPVPFSLHTGRKPLFHNAERFNKTINTIE